MKLENRGIEDEGNSILKNHLRKMFASGNLSLLPNESNPNQEKGIDIFFTVTEMNAKGHIMLFTNQNKSTEKSIKTISDIKNPYYGKIPFPLSIEDVENFYYNIDEPHLFTRTFNNDNSAYWYFIQLDTTIEIRLKEAIQNGKNFIQIYLDPSKKIIPEKFEEFYSELKDCKIHQLRKKTGNSFVKNKNFFEKKEYQNLNMLDKLIKTINAFKPLNVIPFDVLKKSYPFSLENPCVMSEYHLYSDNEELYDFLSSIRNDESGLRISDSAYDDDDFKKKMEDVISFFHNNLIFHFSSSKKDKKKTICIHDLVDIELCNCSKCMMNRFNIQSVQNLLKSELSSIPEDDKLNLAFTAYLAGEIKISFNIFKDVFLNSSAGSFNKIIATYNLQRIKPYKYHWYFYDSLSEDDQEFIESITHNLSELSSKKYISKSIDWLKSHKFVYYENISLDEILSEVDALFRSDKRGGGFKNQKFLQATFIFNRAVTFIEGNLLLFQDYQDFKVLLRKYFEISLALQNIRNPNSSKNDGISKALIRQLIFFLSPQEITRVLKKYDVQNLKVNDLKLTEQYFLEVLTNLHLYFKSINKGKTSYLLKDKIHFAVESIGILVSYISFSSPKKFEKILGAYINVYLCMNKVQDVRYLDMHLIFRKQPIENLKILEDFLTFWVQKEKVYDRTTYEILNKINKAGILDNHLNSIKKAIEIDKEDFEKLFYEQINKYEYLLKFEIIRKIISEKIKVKALKRLKEKFDSNYFYNLTIFKMIPLEHSLLSEFQKSIPDMNQNYFEESPFLKPRINERLSRFINMLLYFNIEIKESHRALSLLSNNKDYYDWLMNLEGFDYAKFEIDWILLYKTSPILNHIRNSDVAMKHIIYHLKKDYSEGSAKTLIFNLLN